MKCSAAESDIHHLFGIMLGRKPSPASYFDKNKGRPLRELTARMAASPEFSAKVIEPILKGDITAEDDRQLSPDEKTWLRSSVQLPKGYQSLLEHRPTRHQAALALTARVLEASPGSHADLAAGVFRAFNSFGLEPVREAGRRNPVAGRKARAAIPAATANEIAALFGGAGVEAPDFTGSVPVEELAQWVVASRQITDAIVPALFAAEGPGAGASGVIEALEGSVDDAASPLFQVMAAAAAADADAGDGVETLLAAARNRAWLTAMIEDGHLGAALLHARRLVAGGEVYLADILQRIRQAVQGEEGADLRLAECLIDRLAEVRLQEAPLPVSVLTRGAAGGAVTAAEPDHLYIVVDEGVRVPELVRSVLSVAMPPDTALPVRVVDRLPAAQPQLTSFKADPVGVAALGGAALREAMGRDDWRDLPAGPFFVPSAPAILSQAAVSSGDAEPVIVALSGAEVADVGHRTIRIDEETTLQAALAAHGIADHAPVILLAGGIDYGPDYVDMALSHHTRFGAPDLLPLLTVRFSTTGRKASLSPAAEREGDHAPLIWLPMSVISGRVARAIDAPLREVAASLFGTAQMLERAGLGAGRGMVLGAVADHETRSRNAGEIAACIEQWQCDLSREAPPLAPNLPAMEALGAESASPVAARRAVAKRVLTQIDETLAILDRVDLGRACATELDPVATDENLDLLLDYGAHARLENVVPKLLANRGFCRAASADTLVWLMRVSRMAGFQRESAAAMRFTLQDILANEFSMLREAFDFLAGCVEPAALVDGLIRFLCENPGKLTSRNARRCADILRLYGDWEGAVRFLEVLRDQGGEDGGIPIPVSNRIGAALLRGDRPVHRLPVEDLVGPPENHLCEGDRIKHAIQAGSAADTLTALRLCLADQPDLRRHLDPLRALAAEAAQLGLGRDDLPYHHCADDTDTAIMALLFGDLDVMRRIQREGDFDDAPDIPILLAACLGDLSPLRAELAHIARPHDFAVPAFDGADQRRIFDGYLSAKAAPALAEHGRVSVVLSTLDTEGALLTASVQSVLNQSYRDLEVILIDDGGGAAAAEAIAKVADLDPRIRPFTMPRNMGPYLCRNFALSVATGDFIAIQDADDISHPGRIAAQVARLAADERLELVTSNHLRVDQRGWPQFEHGFRLFGDGTMTSLFRRSIFDRLGGFQPVRSRGDVEYRERIRRWCGAEAIHHIDFPLIACHASPQTLSQRTAHAKGPYLQLFRKAIDEIRLHPSRAGKGVAPSLAIPAPLVP
ncbi:glycosyltransferase family 2 protein [Rhodobacteraceae bacterium NNCM2]|nr:glycosyltransferase family 2 protein [Coraliihabitans acroporae]